MALFFISHFWLIGREMSLKKARICQFFMQNRFKFKVKRKKFTSITKKFTKFTQNSAKTHKSTLLSIPAQHSFALIVLADIAHSHYVVARIDIVNLACYATC